MWFRLLLALFIVLPVNAGQALPNDPDTGLTIDSNWEQVRAICTVCHSAQLVTQNRMSRQAWLDTIRWMQKEHGLIALDGLEEPILDYLAKNYSADERNKIRSRRRNLELK
jgi:hypothetical protein